MKTILKLATVVALMISLSSCGERKEESTSTGIKKVDANISTGSDGRTTEQRNIVKRLETDNKVGSIKHLYVVSAYSGDVIIYSTVDGKVTSGGKRLSNTVRVDNSANGKITVPTIQDDGTYGTSMNYLYWFDAKGVYHQHYVTGGQIVHISDRPIAVKSVIINMEVSK